VAKHILCFANQKGGVGKTTSAVNVAWWLAKAGERTLLVDCDPQANATVSVLGQQEPAATLYDLLARDRKLADVIVTTPVEHLDLVPGTLDLAGAEVELARQVGSQTILRSKFRSNGLRSYDYVLLDTPPSLGHLTLNALAASTDVIIPVSASFFALKGLGRLQETIELVRDRLDCPELHISGIVCTLYDHTNIARDVYEHLKSTYGEQVFSTIIPKNVKVEEAHSRGQSVFAYAPDSKGAVAYEDLTKEILSRGQ